MQNQRFLITYPHEHHQNTGIRMLSPCPQPRATPYNGYPLVYSLSPRNKGVVQTPFCITNILSCAILNILFICQIAYSKGQITQETHQEMRQRKWTFFTTTSCTY